MKAKFFLFILPALVLLPSCSQESTTENSISINSSTVLNEDFTIHNKRIHRVEIISGTVHNGIVNLDYYLAEENIMENFIFDICYDFSDKYSVKKGFGPWTLNIDYEIPQGNIFVANMSIFLNFSKPQIKLGGVDKIYTFIKNYRPIFCDYDQRVNSPKITLAPISSSMFESAVEVHTHVAKDNVWSQSIEANDYLYISYVMSKYTQLEFNKVPIVKNENPEFSKYSFGIIDLDVADYVSKYNSSPFTFRQVLIKNFANLLDTKIKFGIILENITISVPEKPTDPWEVNTSIKFKEIFIETTSGSQIYEIKGCHVS